MLGKNCWGPMCSWQLHHSHCGILCHYSGMRGRNGLGVASFLWHSLRQQRHGWFGRRRCLASSNDHGKNIFLKKWKMKNRMYDVRRLSPSDDSWEQTPPLYHYDIFLSTIGSSVSTPSDNQGNQSSYFSWEEGPQCTRSPTLQCKPIIMPPSPHHT